MKKLKSNVIQRQDTYECYAFYVSDLLSWGNEITNPDGKKIGKIIKWKKKYAIGLLQLPLLYVIMIIIINNND